MALTKYTYSKTTDFTSLVGDDIWIPGLAREIVNDATVPASSSIDEGITDPDDVDIWFDPALTTQEETALDAVVAAHTGVVTPNKVLRVSSSQDYEYTSVKAAVDWIVANGSPSSTNSWVIEVYPGLYSEDPFTIPAYVTVSGVGTQFEATLATSNNGAHFITMAAASNLARLMVKGPTGSGYAAINFTGTGGIPAFLRNISIQAGYYGIWVHPASAGNLIGFECSTYYSGFTITEFLRVSDYGTGTLLLSSCAGGPPGSVTRGYVCEGANTSMNLDTCSYSIATGTAVYVNNDAADVRLSSVTIAIAAKGIHVGGTGTLSHIHSVGCEIDEHNVTVPIQTDTATCLVLFNGTMKHEDCILADDGTLKGLSVDGDDTNVRGEFTCGGSTNEVAVSDYLRSTSNTGYVSGGVVTRGTGLDVDVTAGTGFICVAGTKALQVSWDADTITLSANTISYLYVDSTGTIQVSEWAVPSKITGILLAIAVSGVSSVDFMATVNIAIEQLASNNALFFEECFGILNVSGGVVSEYGTPGATLQVQVSESSYWAAAQRKVLAVSGTPATFTYWYRSSTPGAWVPVASQTDLDPDFYDDGSGTLAAVPAGEFKRDLMFGAVSGDGSEYHVVYGQETWATAVEADENPLTPDIVTDHAQRLYAAILEEGATGIEDLVDQRPRIGILPAGISGGGITVHNDLTGRDATDAHSQYQLLTAKGVASGYAPLDSGSLVPNANLPYSAVAGANVSTAAAVVGAGDIARVGHTHQVQTSAPTQGIGGGNTLGAGPNLAMSNHDHKLRETSGPTELTIAAVADGQFLVRSGTTIVGSGATTGTTLYRWFNFGGNSVTSIGDYVAVSVASNAGVRLSFAFPPNFASLVSLNIYGIPNGTFTDQDIDLTSDYAAPGELYNAHEQSDITSVYSGVINTIWTLNAAGVFSGAAANDVAGLYIKHNGIGATVYYLGIRMGYIST